MNRQAIRAWWAAALCFFLLPGCNSGEDHTDSPVAAHTLTYRLGLTPTTANVAVGHTVPLTGTLVDSEGRTVANPQITYASDAAGVARVDAAGVVTGIAAGTARVTASATAPDGSALSQQATVAVTLPAVTYNVVSANPTLNLQYNQPTTASVTVLGSDGSDVTAQATGWTWVSSDVAVVTPNPTGASATLTATNSSATTAASASITVTAVAPDGSTVTGQIAVTALPHYVYNISLSATSTKVSSDRPAVVTATVMRSDGLDVTSQFSNWQWATLGASNLSIGSSGGPSATVISSYADQSAQDLAEVTFSFLVKVTAVGPGSTVSAPPASLALSQVPAYTVVTPLTVSGPNWNLRLYHTSDDLSPAVPCALFQSPGPMPVGSALTYVGATGNMFLSNAPTPGTYNLTLSCTPAGRGPILSSTTVTLP
ncbi:Ig-like domain-containing protein [Cupriavidus pauculus]|uniref:Ig-like domain-containing protein n=1 Tax=Cupriavidus pauculus TaxID=82633 RepID=UPI001245E072|nr:Ig-like domain-containing protein [Cupriavidus pauculus]KAB0603973.1 hypothetical protein F7R19_07635 [Cupriavidus pauculus]UAL03211.1 Ig-like domain-containing protein [Cupriavidus pauculus]